MCPLQQETQLLKSFMQMLPHFAETTAIVPLRLQLLTACLQFLQRACAAPGTVSTKKSLQASFYAVKVA